MKHASDDAPLNLKIDRIDIIEKFGIIDTVNWCLCPTL